jgi:hypothetical protein
MIQEESDMAASRRAGAGVIALAAAFGLMHLPAQAEDALVPECRIEVETEAVPVSDEPVVVEARATAALGAEVAIAIDEESGIRLVSAGREEEDAPETLRLTLDTSEAEPGEWALVVRSENIECTGTVVVAEADGR